MNKKIRFFIILVFFFIGISCCVKSQAAGYTSGSVTYTYQNYSNGVMITYIEGVNSDNSINIPSTIGGKNVLKLENSSDNVISSPNVVTLKLPDTLVELGANSIVDCTNLQTIYIPYSVTTLSDTFISNCSKLKTIYVDENVNSNRSGIKQSALINQITGKTPTINKYTEGGYTFSRYAVGTGNNMEAKIYDYNGSNDVNIPTTLKSIPVYELNNAFKENENITSISGGSSLTILREKEFYGCKSLKSVDLSNTSIGIIGKNAFTRCYELETVKIGKHVTNVGNYAFEIVDTKGATDEPADEDHKDLDGGKLKEVTIITDNDIEISQGAFQRDANLETISIKSKTTTIGKNSFRNCTNLKNVNITKNTDVTGTGDVSIGESAFEKCESLETFNFGDVTKIEAYAFKSCTSLNNVQFGDKLKSMGAAAFAYCENFPSEITLPKNFQSIGIVPFLGCEKLKAINVNEENSLFTSMDGVLVGIMENWHDGKDKVEIKVYPEGKDDITIYKVPTEITDVAIGAFASNQLTSIEIQNPNGTNGLVTVDGAIYSGDDSEMKLLAYPGNTVNAILDSRTISVESYALYGIKAHIIRIPGAKDIKNWGIVHWIGNLKDENPIIYYYGKLSDGGAKISGVYLEDNVTVYCVKSDTNTDKSILGDAKIKYMINGENYIIYQDSDSDSNLIIEPLESGYYTENGNIKDAIVSNIDWTKLELDKVEDSEGEEIVSATDIEQEINSVEIKEGIKELGDKLFMGFPNLKEVTLPNSLTTIGSQVFYKDESLSEITIPDSVTNIGKYAFRNCTNLSTITLSKNMTEISEGLFMDSGLEKIKYNNSDNENVLSSNIKKIGAEAFRGTKLESIYIPDGVETIEDRAFENCKDLTDVTISSSVTSIGKNVFAGCSKDLIIKGEKGSQAEKYATNNNIKFQNITLPESIKLSKSSVQLDLNGTDEEKITYTISPTDADTDIQITWKSDNESVATVDNGTIKAVGIGKCVITATTENGKSATCDVTVIKSNNSEDDDKNNGNNGSGDKDNNNGNNGSEDKDNNNGNNGSGDEDNNNGNNDINNGNNGSNGSEENGNNGGNSGLKNNGGSDNGTKFSSSNSGVIEESYGDSTSDKDIPYTGYKVALGLGIIIAGIISTLSYIKFRKMDI